MRDKERLLKEKFTAFLTWERSKNREKVLLSAFFYSLLGSLLLLPAVALLAPFEISLEVESWLHPLATVPLLFVILTLPAHWLHPWGKRETVRTIVRLDRALHLEERALTAWEILDRSEKKMADQWVLEEASTKLQNVDPKALFGRQRSWHLLLAPPLFFLWLLLFWLDVGVHFSEGLGMPRSIPLAQRLKEFAEEIEKRAVSQGLPESLKAAGMLKEVADKGLKKEIGEAELRAHLDAAIPRSEDIRTGTGENSDLSFATSPGEELSHLRAEIEDLKAMQAGAEIGARLAALPRLDKEMEERLSRPEPLSREEAGKFLDRLEQSVMAELDRRTLQEVQEFLAVLIPEMKGKETAEAARERADAWIHQPSKGEQSRGKGALPGDELGKKGRGPETFLPKAAAATHLKGLLGEGKGRSLRVQGELRGKESEIPQEEVVTAYRRQAEQALASEEIPEGLKETIKRYFVSIGITEEKNEK